MLGSQMLSFPHPSWPGLALSLTPQQPTTLPSAAATRHFRLKPNGELLYLSDCNGWAGVKVQASSVSFPIDFQAAMSGATRCLLVIHMCPPPTSNGGWRDSLIAQVAPERAAKLVEIVTYNCTAIWYS